MAGVSMSKTGYVDHDGDWQHDEDHADAMLSMQMEEPIPLTDYEEYDLLAENADEERKCLSDNEREMKYGMRVEK
jgi:hypothetical protein